MSLTSEAVKAALGAPPITFWSFSALKQFERCPYETYLQRVMKSPRLVKEVEDPADPLVRGNRVHKEAELYVKGEGPLTKDLKKFAEQFLALQDAFGEGRVEVEKNWLYSAEWGPATWDDKTCIIKLDAGERLTDTSYRFVDYKTGKSWGKEVAHVQQMQLYAIGALMRYPELLVVQSELWYLDEGKTTTRLYSRDVLPQLVARYESRAEKLLTATVFPPKPNKGNCRFCDFGVANGTGACPYAVPQ